MSTTASRKLSTKRQKSGWRVAWTSICGTTVQGRRLAFLLGCSHTHVSAVQGLMLILPTTASHHSTITITVLAFITYWSKLADWSIQISDFNKSYYKLASKSKYTNNLPVGQEKSFEDESWNKQKKYISMIETTKL